MFLFATSDPMGVLGRVPVLPFLQIFGHFGVFLRSFMLFSVHVSFALRGCLGDFFLFFRIFDPAATAAEQSTATQHQRLCAARQSPSGGPWSKRPLGTPRHIADFRNKIVGDGGSTTRRGGSPTRRGGRGSTRRGILVSMWGWAILVKMTLKSLLGEAVVG